MEIILATHNAHKKEEFIKLLPVDIQIQSLDDMGYDDEIIENGASFEENAHIKAETLYTIFNKPAMGEDSGLIVPFLDGAPGIYSARYAGTGKAEDNMAKLLSELNGVEEENRKAYFQTSICLIVEGDVHYFTGTVQGSIHYEPKGHEGFGYDPIFIPDGYHQSFAELGMSIKNSISHRAKAIQQCVKFIENTF